MQKKIITYIETELLSGQENVNLSSDEDLLTTGLIDSLGIMKLIAYLEEEFKITIPAEDMTIEYFMTVDDMADYIATRQSVTV
jgi:acyl carrier protein